MSILKLTKSSEGTVISAAIDDKEIEGFVSVTQNLERGLLKATITATFDSVETEEVGPVPEAPAADLVAVFAAGSAAGTTKATVTGSVGAGNSLAYKFGTMAETKPNVGDVIVGMTSYTSGSDITGIDATSKKHIALYELSAGNKAVKFLAHVVLANEIKE